MGHALFAARPHFSRDAAALLYPDGGVDGPFPLQAAENHGQIDLFRFPCQQEGRVGILGREKQAACVTVQPVDRPEGRGLAFFFIIRDDAVGEGWVRLAGGRVHREVGRLVHHEQVGVLIHHRQRHLHSLDAHVVFRKGEDHRLPGP